MGCELAPLVHVDYRDVKFVDDENGHLKNQAKSQLSIEKMNEINAKLMNLIFHI